jgi:glycosyltransferase involved in cell wall biosynthesis
MIEQPLISVITVVYNGVTTLEQTILSVINQTYKNIEYIIIDGGSTDGTVDIIKKYEKHLAYWVSEPDKGIYDAMNKGIYKVTGEWINFMNSGDIFCNIDIVQQLMTSNLLSNNQTIIFGDRVTNCNGKLVDQKININSIRYIMCICHQSCFVSTILHQNYPFDISYKIAGDYDFFYKMLNKNVEFIKINLNICVFCGGGVSGDIWNRYKEFIKVIKTNNRSYIHKILYIILCIYQHKGYFIKRYFPLFY